MPQASHLATALGLLAACASGARAQPGGKPAYIQMADSVIARHPNPLTIDAVQPKWEYTQGLVLRGIFAVGEKTGDPRYFDYARKYYDEMIDVDGKIRTYVLEEYNIDRINPGKALFSLYEKT